MSRKIPDVPGLAILGVTSWLVPRSRRTEWLAEWKAELAWAAERRRDCGSSAWGTWFALNMRAAQSVSDAWLLRSRSLGAGAAAMDVRLALRLIRRRPFVYGVIVLTLALAIGANTAIFSVVNSALMGSLPIGAPDRVVRVWMRNAGEGWTRVDASLPDFEDWQSELSSFDAIAAYNPRDGNLGGPGQAERVEYALVTPAFFAVMGVEPVRGRFISPSDDIPGADDIVVISHAFWQVRLGADPDVIGRTIQLDGRRLTVIGISPPGFAYPSSRTVAWKPLAMHGLEAGPREGRWLSVVGRLGPGVEVRTANVEVTTVTANLQRAYAATDAGWDAWIEPVRDVDVASVRTPILLAWAAVLLVLIVACANVTNLQLGLALRRSHEMAVRGALGAGRSVIVRQLLTESVIVAVFAGGLGTLLARPGVNLVARLGETAASSGVPPDIDSRVLLYTLVVVLIAGTLTGLLPALRGAGYAAIGPRLTTRGAVGSRSRIRAGLVSFEVAAAVIILVGAGLLGRSLAALRAVDVGLPLEDRLTLRVAPSWADVPERLQAIDLFRRIEEHVAAIPGVLRVGAANRLPLDGPWWTGGLVFRDRPEPQDGERSVALNRVVTPGYVEALGLRLVRGRDLSDSDDASAARVVLISESVARRYWPDGDPLGAAIAFAPPSFLDVQWHTVVGVVSDAVYGDLGGELDDVVYTSFAQATWGHFNDWGMGIVVASVGEPLALVTSVRAAIAAVDPTLPVYGVQTMEGRVNASLEGRRHGTAVISAFAALTLALATIGTYAVIAFNVNRQTREIGLRLALGEPPRRVLRGVLGRGLAPALAGVGVGLPAAWVAARAIRSQLFGVAPLDGITFAGIVALLLGVSFLACLVPAVRASRLSPLDSLGTD